MSSLISSYISVLFSASKVFCLLWDYIKEFFFQKQGIGDNFLKKRKIKEKGAFDCIEQYRKIFTEHKIISWKDIGCQFARVSFGFFGVFWSVFLRWSVLYSIESEWESGTKIICKVERWLWQSPDSGSNLSSEHRYAQQRLKFTWCNKWETRKKTLKISKVGEIMAIASVHVKFPFFEYVFV